MKIGASGMAPDAQESTRDPEGFTGGGSSEAGLFGPRPLAEIRGLLDAAVGVLEEAWGALGAYDSGELSERVASLTGGIIDVRTTLEERERSEREETTGHYGHLLAENQRLRAEVARASERATTAEADSERLGELVGKAADVATLNANAAQARLAGGACDHASDAACGWCVAAPDFGDLR